MADFRRITIVLVALALIALASTGTASAAGMTCSSTASATQMRGEGQTEKGGDFILTCTGGTPTDPSPNVAPTVNITVFLNTTDVTSRILTTSDNATEALLLVDEPAEAAQKVCIVSQEQSAGCPVVGLGASANSPYLAAGAYNVFQGQWGGLTARNEIIFSGVPIAAPGTMGGTRTIRITNIRANASEIAIAVSGAPSSVTETLGVSNTAVLPIGSNNATQTIGLVQLGLITSLQSPAPANLAQCTSTTFSLAANIQLNKGFGAAWRIRNIATTPTNPAALANQDAPGTTYNTETFFYNAAQGVGGSIDGIIGSEGGLADAGTRIRIKFTNIPAGVTVMVPTDLEWNPNIVNNAVVGPVNNQGNIYGAPNLYAHLTAGEVGAYSAISADDTNNPTFYDIPQTSGTGEAVYEILQANTSSLSEYLVVPVYVSYTASPGTNSPAINVQAGVEASFAPVLSDSAAPMASQDQVPRFVDLSKVGNAFIVSSCATHLLFPYVTNMAGFDTGIAISNTSLDEYNTSPQTGACTLWPFAGGKALASYTSPSVTAGSTWTALVDATATPIVGAGFSGYIIADCDFQYAHGFAFITQIGTFLGTEGYLAEIIPDPALNNRSAQPFDQKANGGEQLGF